MGERIGHKKGAMLHSGKGGAGGAGVGTRAAAGGLAGGGENQGEKGEKETKEWDEEKGNVKPNHSWKKCFCLREPVFLG